MEILNFKKVLMASVPADGHFNPLTALAKTLQEKGCDVRWYTSAFYSERLNRLRIPHYPFKKALDVNASNITQLIPEIRTNDPVKRITIYRIQYAKRSIECYEDIKDILTEFPADLIVTDSLFPAIPFIKHLLDAPLIAIGVVPLAEDSYDTAPYGLGLLPPETEEQREMYRELYKQNTDRYKEATDLFQSFLSAAHIPFERTIMESALIKYPDLYLQIGCPGFEYLRGDLGNNIRFIGGLLPYRQPGQRTVWTNEKLNRYDKVVLVTKGTVETDTTKLIEPTLNAFLGTDILVVVATGGHSTAELNSKYAADNIVIEDFIPFEDIMPHADVFVTNGGYGGTIMSIMNRVPLLTAGLHEGKNEICARVDHFGIGIDLHTETPTEEAISCGVQEILNNPSYKENVSSLAGEMAGYDPVGLFFSYAQSLVKASGISSSDVSINL